MKCSVELNSFFSKFFCYIPWFVISPDQTRHWTTCERALYVKSYCFFKAIAQRFKNQKLFRFLYILNKKLIEHKKGVAFTGNQCIEWKLLLLVELNNFRGSHIPFSESNPFQWKPLFLVVVIPFSDRSSHQRCTV